jgi:tetratricopeptide (TPR) repeat protein
VTSTLGEIYAAQGQFEKAIEVYEALIEKAPNESRYIEKIADLKKRLKESSGK